MYGTTINNKGKSEKNKKVKEGNCIFPFKYKFKTHNECVNTEKGDICATSVNSNNTLQTYGYCVPFKKSSNSKTIKKKKSKKKTTRKLKIVSSLKSKKSKPKKLVIVDSLKESKPKNTTIKIPAHNIPAFKPAKIFVEGVKSNVEVK